MPTNEELTKKYVGHMVIPSPGNRSALCTTKWSCTGVIPSGRLIVKDVRGLRYEIDPIEVLLAEPVNQISAFAIHPDPKKWMSMISVHNACINAGIMVPDEVMAYLVSDDIYTEKTPIEIRKTKSGYEIDATRLPPGTKHITWSFPYKGRKHAKPEMEELVDKMSMAELHQLIVIARRKYTSMMISGEHEE